MAKTTELARALLLRKELMAKCSQLHAIKEKDLFETRVQRRQINENVDDITATVPLLSAKQVTAEFDWYAKALREVDATIQHTNWITMVEIPDWVSEGYKEPAELVRK